MSTLTYSVSGSILSHLANFWAYITTLFICAIRKLIIHLYYVYSLTNSRYILEKSLSRSLPLLNRTLNLPYPDLTHSYPYITRLYLSHNTLQVLSMEPVTISLCWTWCTRMDLDTNLTVLMVSAKTCVEWIRVRSKFSLRIYNIVICNMYCNLLSSDVIKCYFF